MEGVAAWIEEAPRLVEELAVEWNLTLGRVLEGGTESLVVTATSPDHGDVVVKAVVPRRDLARGEAGALRLADGRGAARLLAFDAERETLLVERLGPSLADAGLSASRRHEILADVAARFWTPIEPGPMTSGAEKGRWLAEYIEERWSALGHPCSRAAVDNALTCAERRVAAHDEERAVLVHGDIHQWNTLRCGDDWALIDPDGMVAEPAYDLGIIMREDPEEMLAGDPRDRSRFLADRTGMDETAIWEWGVIERVATGLAARSIGLEPAATLMLRVADRIAVSG